jgi:riboflavin kinase/FMN adenylyltransferase
MDVIWLPDAQPRPRHVAVGEFDGVHLGHREVMRGAETVLTFEPHPSAVVAPEKAPKLITPLETKIDLIAGLGVRELVVIPFDGAFASQSPQGFIDDVLVGQLGATKVSVGENFRFGHRARGDVALLRAQDAFETRVVELIQGDGGVISSSHIRELIAAGEVERAAACLGSPFQLRGTATSAGARSASRPRTSSPTRR